MKKILYTVLATFVMTVAFVSCKDSKSSTKDADDEERTEVSSEEKDGDGATVSSGTPADKLVAKMEDVVKLMKGTTIKSADDAQKLKENMESFKAEVESLMGEMMNAYKDKSAEEMEKLAEDMKGLEEKMEAISKEAEAESERLKKEAEAAGVNLEDFEDLL